MQSSFYEGIGRAAVWSLRMRYGSQLQAVAAGTLLVAAGASLGGALILARSSLSSRRARARRIALARPRR